MVRAPMQAMNNRRRNKDPLVHQTVRIIRGPWKGYIGIVKDCTDTTARVELHTSNKTINVERAIVTEIAPNASASAVSYDSADFRRDYTMTPIRGLTGMPSLSLSLSLSRILTS